jgi:hypothetical protein
MADSDERFQVYAVTEIRRAGKGLPVYREGGPLNGAEQEIPLLGAGVIASRDVADGLPGVDDGRLLLLADGGEAVRRAVRVPVRRAAAEGLTL